MVSAVQLIDIQQISVPKRYTFAYTLSELKNLPMYIKSLIGMFNQVICSIKKVTFFFLFEATKLHILKWLFLLMKADKNHKIIITRYITIVCRIIAL